MTGNVFQMLNNYELHKLDRIIQMLEEQELRLTKIEGQVEHLAKLLDPPSWQYLSQSLASDRLKIVEHASGNH
ncbi:hypothetical protein [Synechococcus sp. MIT S9503]|uniref:hypothetical protein n=1 Tax=Synechococcus sp. MIT S9503 TaxID=3082547 RepID=UPI0039A4FAF7